MAGKVGKISLGPSPTGGTSFLILALWRPLSGCSARIGARSSADLKEFQLAESSRCAARSGWQIPFFAPCSDRPWGKSHKAGLPLSQCVQRRHLHWGGSPAPPLPSQLAAETGAITPPEGYPCQRSRSLQRPTWNTWKVASFLGAWAPFGEPLLLLQ